MGKKFLDTLVDVLMWLVVYAIFFFLLAALFLW